MFKELFLILTLLLTTNAFPTDGIIMGQLTTLEGHQMILDNHDNEIFTIIDVRTLDEYNTGHIAGTINIDFFAFDFMTKLKELPREMKYFLYCRSGRRSRNAQKNMQKLQFIEVYNLLGGIKGWVKEQLPVVIPE